MSSLQTELASVLAEKLSEAATEFALKPIRILDVGVFPWHTSMELSFLCEGDSADEGEIAAWPLYEFSKISEGKWEAVKPICSIFNKEWEVTMEFTNILRLTAAAMKEPVVQQVINQLPKAPSFKIQVLNPDSPSSPNYFDE
jgi:hypothetical protein